MLPHRRQLTRLPHPWDLPVKNTGVGCHFLLQCMKVKSEREVAQSCPTPSDPMDCSPPGSSAHGIFQARVLEWGAIAFTYPIPPQFSSLFYSQRSPVFKGRPENILTVAHFIITPATQTSLNRRMLKQIGGRGSSHNEMLHNNEKELLATALSSVKETHKCDIR